MIQVDATIARGRFTLKAAFAARGPVTVLFGPSGAGKSSLAALFTGLIKPTSGRVELNGVDVANTATGQHLSSPDRRMGYVFQDALLFPHLTVRDNLLYGARRRQIPAPPLQETVRQLGLGHLLDRRPSGLSGGEARRVAIGRALLSQPDLLILDEPLAGLDGAMRGEILSLIEQMARSGPPILYITHSLEEAARLADDVVLVADGCAFNAGPPALAFSRPEAEQAAGLSAPVSVLEGRVMAGHGRSPPSVVDLGWCRFHTPPLTAQPGERARIIIDARDVALTLEDPTMASFQNRLAVKVVALTSRHDGILVDLEAPGLMLKALITQQAAKRLGLAPSSAVIALIKATALSRQR